MPKETSCLTKRSRSKCHLTECFWELPWSSVFVAMETDKQCFRPRKEVVIWTSWGHWQGSASLYSEVHTIQRLISCYFFRLSLFYALECVYLCLSFRLSAQRTEIFDTAINTSSSSIACKDVKKKQIEFLNDLNSRVLTRTCVPKHRHKLNLLGYCVQYY